MHYYVEADGRVYLVDRDGVLDLPTRAELPFAIEEVAPLAGGSEVVFAVPRLPRHPAEWPSKDALASGPGVSDRVREAIHAGMPRVVVEGLCIRGETILLVKGSRGFTAGRWSLPGGFVRFGESPEEGLRREIEEELGVVACTLEGEGVRVRAKLGRGSCLHWIMIFYSVALEGDPAPNPDEIAEARFVRFDKAAGLLFDDVMREVVATAAEARSATR